MIYFFEGEARRKGAIGITHHFCAEVHAESQKEAELALYDEWEHIRITTCNEHKEKP
jgi:hypothetical protein